MGACTRQFFFRRIGCYKLDRLLTSAAAAADAAATAAVAEVALVVDGLAPPGHRQKLRPPK